MPAFTREFPLDPDILGQGSAVNLAVDAPGSPAAAAAIAANRPFPDGPIALGQISVGAGTGSGLVFKSGAATVSFTSSAEIQAGIGIFDSPADAVASFALPSAKNLDLEHAAGGQRRAGAMGRHALGVQRHGQRVRRVSDRPGRAAASVGVAASRAGVYGVVHCFDSGAGARDVLVATSKSWRLPRQVNFDGTDVNLAPHTWLVAEVDGSLALTVGARLGYEVSFSREATLAGLTRDLGATIDAKLKATFGVTASGSYLLMIGRESEARTVRLRLHKHAKSGLDFALNLDVGLTGTVPLPDTFDDFVETVFGVHGPQVVRDLHVLEQWTDPKADFGENVARLTTKTGLDLLRQATGLDPEREVRRGEGHRARRAEEMGRAAAGRCRDDVAVPVEEDAGRRRPEVQVVSGNARRRRCRQEDTGAVERAGPGARGQAGAEMAAGDRRPRDPRGRAGPRSRQRACARHAGRAERRRAEAPPRLHRRQPEPRARSARPRRTRTSAP